MSPHRVAKQWTRGFEREEMRRHSHRNQEIEIDRRRIPTDTELIAYADAVIASVRNLVTSV